jgi:hypothetical protein
LIGDICQLAVRFSKLLLQLGRSARNSGLGERDNEPESERTALSSSSSSSE